MSRIIPTSNFELSRKDGCRELNHGEAAAVATDIYGNEAATAVAYCALEAWVDRRTADYDFWFEVFRRLMVSGVPVAP
ncbi:hypothetical protein [Sinorhizobium sp. NFACC03]|uniref:hypothetical protein n=1 Tax=Sinorhizobium sp. NFACC03 TaxID=1566295 RepID=UPI00087F31E4|nr:hypothetical protein [Sinorhizobium sp. NFACC03]SDA87613.1 hypothetical protein SAMN03159448_03993 [Sinorhizobium sp. NFACC03]